jgi:hypothetical protein
VARLVPCLSYWGKASGMSAQLTERISFPSLLVSGIIRAYRLRPRLVL